MNRARWAAIVAVLLAAGTTRAEDAKPGAKPERTPAELVPLAEKLMPSLVQVEYSLQYDKGERPEASGGRGRYGHTGGESLIQQERPLEIAGFVVAADQVVTRDLAIHPRFIKDLAVRCGEQSVKARVAGYFTDHDAVLLKLDEPLKSAKPLAFQAEAKPPYYSVGYLESDGAWTVTVRPNEMHSACAAVDGRKFAESDAADLIVDAAGVPVGAMPNSEVAPDDAWKGSPLKWAMASAEQMAAMTAAVTRKVDAGIYHVKLHFRSPKKDASRYSPEGGPVEQNVLGLLVEPRKMLVLAGMTPKITARLEQVSVLRPGGEPVNAKFACTLTDFNGLLVDLDQPLGEPVAFSKDKIQDARDVLLLAVEVRIQGEQRIVYYNRSRIEGFHLGWKRELFPETAGREDQFLFRADGALVAFPLGHRPKVAARGEYYSSGGPRELMPVGYLAAALADVAKASDPDNVPLTEEQEGRLAWMGVELQPLDPELARANKVSDLTNEGQTGAMVSYVYPNSPAAKAGIQPGYILLRLNVTDQPKPIDVRLDRYGSAGEQFPWDELDRVPDRYFDRIPKPWPAVENSFTRTLTDLGFGKSYKAEFFADGKTIALDFKTEQSPPHHDSAPKYQNKDLGLTVRDLTYEVRRYFTKKPDDPGVIVSKIEQGSKASVGGLKPYEIITQVNDQPVNNVKDFERLVAQTKGDLRLSVKRMARGRLVKLDMAAPAPAPKTQPEAGPQDPAD